MDPLWLAPMLAVAGGLNASNHLFGFPSKVENPDVLEPVRMSAGNAQAEERRLLYVAITRAMKRLPSGPSDNPRKPLIAREARLGPLFQLCPFVSDYHCRYKFLSFLEITSAESREGFAAEWRVAFRSC